MENRVATLSNRDLVDAVGRLSTIERNAMADLIEALAEFDARRLYFAEGFPSLFAYCTARLGLSEHEAYHRIEAARAARRFPVVLVRLRERSLTLTAVGLLQRHLTEANCVDVLDAACGKSKREVQELVARLSPRPDVVPSIRKVPRKAGGIDVARLHADHEAPSNASARPSPDVLPSAPAPPASAIPLLVSSAASSALTVTAEITATGVPTATAADRPSRPGTIRPLAPARYHLHVTVDAQAHAALRQLQDLLRSEVPNGDPAVIVGRALSFLLGHVERRKFAATNKTRAVTAKGHVTAPPDLSPGGDGAIHPESGADSESDTRHVAPPALGARYIPAEVRRAVWTRDEGRCTFVGHAGRCPERAALEFHHRVPVGKGGETTIENVALACRGHNHWQAAIDFGEETMRAHRGRTG
jgi:hypothetical protein